MSEAVSIQRSAPRGMIQVRADLSDATVQAVVEREIGCGIPPTRGVATVGDATIVWMSPDELLVICADADLVKTVAALQDAFGEVHHLCADVSDARAMFTVSGQRWREVLAKGMPVDFRPASFSDGQVRRSRLGQVAAAVWMSGPDAANLVCFRSVSDFVEDWLVLAAKDGSVPEVF